MEYGGVPVHEQDQLTPFQRHIILKGAQKQQEEAKKNNGGGNSFPGPTSQPPTNSMHQPGGGIKGDTVTYINDHATDRYGEDGEGAIINGVHYATAPDDS